ncbi:hypothetical protein ACHWQZ_G012664 [Mnemiopsis leidyi]
MDEGLVLLKLKDNGQLYVEKKILTGSGSVFRRIINDLSQSELEIEDFAAEAVKTFVEYIQDGIRGDIAEIHFRDIHKLSVVFDVIRLITNTRLWLKRSIDNLSAGYRFLYEECLYIHTKWNINKFLERFVLKLRFGRNVPLLSQLFIEFESLKPDQMYFILHLTGTNTGIVLSTLIQQIRKKQSLDETTRYALQNINLPLCLTQDVDLYSELFDVSSQLSDISNEDLKIIVGLSHKTTQHVFKKTLGLSQASITKTVYDTRKWFDIEKRCEKLKMISGCTSVGLITSMYDVVEMSARIMMRSEVEPTDIKLQEFVVQLENLEEPLQKVSDKFIKMMISVVKSSGRYEKPQLVKLLKMIRDSKKLSSKFQHVQLVGQLAEGSTLAATLMNIMKIKSSELYIFQYKHPEIRDCKDKGQCGFVIKFNKDTAAYELSEDPVDYQNRDVHTHPVQVFKAEKMSWYEIMHGSRGSGPDQVVVFPRRWRWGWSEWGYQWLGRGEGGLIDWQTGGGQFCIDIDIRDSLVMQTEV